MLSYLLFQGPQDTFKIHSHWRKWIHAKAKKIQEQPEEIDEKKIKL